jgi:hypothetical protein
MRSLVVLLLMLAACSTPKAPSGTTPDPLASSERSRCSVAAVLCASWPCRACSIECPEGKAAVCKPGRCVTDTRGNQCEEDSSCTCQ